jgi:hypothetical protein
VQIPFPSLSRTVFDALIRSAAAKRARDGDDDGSSAPNKKSKVEIDPADKVSPCYFFWGRLE